MREMFTFLLSSLLLKTVTGQSYSVVPVITEQPRDQVITAGGVVYLSCRFSSPDPFTSSVTWYREGRRVDRGEDDDNDDDNDDDIDQDDDYEDNDDDDDDQY